LRVVTDVELENERGVAPDYPSVPVSKRDLFEPLTARERVLVTGIGNALERLVADTERGADPHSTNLALWRLLSATFGHATGMQWQAIPWQ
jgi:hypothetical protein